MWINALYAVSTEQVIRGVKNIVFDNFGDRMAFGGQMLLLGMGTVFSVLILLWIIIALLHLLVGVLPEKLKAARREKAAPAPVNNEKPVSDVPVSAEIAETSAAEADDGELVAAIAAAVASYTGKPQSSFRVVSFKRANKNFSVRNR